MRGGGNTSSEGDAGTSESDGPVEITYVHRLPDNSDTEVQMADLEKQWNDAHPDIQVTITKFDGASQDLIKKVETDVKAGNAPCLAQVGYPEFPEVYIKGLVEDVTQYAEKYEDNFTPGAFELMGIDGKMYGLPQDTGPLVYFYDTQAFKDLGIELPQTADELIEAAKKAAEQGKYIMSYEPDAAVQILAASAAAADDPWFNTEGDQWNIKTDGPGSTKVAELWQKLIDDKSVFLEPRWNPKWDEGVANGTLIGAIGAAWEAPMIAGAGEGSPNAGKWAVVELPNWFDNPDNSTGPYGGSGVAIIKGCQYPEQAMEFNNWLNTQTDALASKGLVVAAKVDNVPPSGERDAAFYAAGEDPMTVMLRASEKMKPFLYVPSWASVIAEMREPSTAIVDGAATVKDVFTAADEGARTALKGFNLKVAE